MLWLGVRVEQSEEASWAVNHTVGRSSPSCEKLAKRCILNVPPSCFEKPFFKSVVFFNGVILCHQTLVKHAEKQKQGF